MNPDDVTDGEFYWILQDLRSRNYPNAQPVLVVAQAFRSDDDRGQQRIYFEGCGTDEGVTPIEIIAHVRRPSVT